MLSQILTYLDAHATDILFNVAALLLFYLLARLLRVGPVAALGIGFAPLILAIVYQSGPTQAWLSHMR